MKDFHGVLYLQKLDIRAATSDLQNDENEVMNEANEVRSEKKLMKVRHSLLFIYGVQNEE